MDLFSLLHHSRGFVSIFESVSRIEQGVSESDLFCCAYIVVFSSAAQ
jgi:hypothetical protein